MKRYFVVNPMAGQGQSKQLAPQGNDTFYTSGSGDAERFVYEKISATDEDVHIVVFGGDGTLNEVVNGIMQTNAHERVLLSMVACGTGNDFVRSFPLRNNEYLVDVIKYNDRYAVNVVNIGFDCEVVNCVSRIKKIPFISGSFAYILGVVNVLCRRLGQRLDIEITDENGNVISVNKELLLCVMANASYYGGGFNAAPLAEPDDGLIDLLTVDKINRRHFISLVGDYKQGKHIDAETKNVIPRFQDIMKYYHCKSIKINTPVNLCADGEINHFNEVEISIIPHALKFISL